jgi:hypothetical protein
MIKGLLLTWIALFSGRKIRQCIGQQMPMTPASAACRCNAAAHPVVGIGETTSQFTL